MSLFNGISQVRSGSITQKQIEYIEDLCEKLNDDDPLEDIHQMSRREASDLIQDLKERLDFTSPSQYSLF